MTDEENLIPRKLWLLWYQGVAEAPFIVKKCIDSWVNKKPTWEVIVLDSSNLNDYIKLDVPEDVLENIPLTQQSDLVRMLLLSKYGGVWADATTFCTKPLDEWIEGCSESGFFVFHKPGRDRVMSIWFVASQKDSPICDKLCNNLRSYWIENNFNKPNGFQRKLISKLSKKFNRSDRTTKHWFNPVVTKILKVYPYFVFHYMFERLVFEDDECKAIWMKTKKVSADLPHLILHTGLFSSLSPSVKKQVDDNDMPLFKLSWKCDFSRYSKDTSLYYLIEGREDLGAE